MEYLDIYDELGNHLGKETREFVHKKALWHNTIHCWLYDKLGNIYFQERKEEQNLYTTASGHVQAGETIKEGFGREVKEEIGINIDYESAQLVEINKYILDRENKDGSIFKDRAFANVYVCLFDGDMNSFNMDRNELNGIVKINAKEALELITKESGSISGTKITPELEIEPIEVDFNYFLVNKGETALEKYGKVLEKVINLTK